MKLIPKGAKALLPSALTCCSTLNFDDPFPVYSISFLFSKIEISSPLSI